MSQKSLYGGIEVSSGAYSNRRGLVVFLAAEELQQIFETWPHSMRVAVCLKEDGDGRLIVFHDDEGTLLLPRVRRALGPSVTEIAASPNTPGFETRRLRFSEEKRILTLVRNSPEVVEEAKDYSINYAFAVEEGLDPVRFLHSSDKQVRQNSPALDGSTATKPHHRLVSSGQTKKKTPPPDDSVKTKQNDDVPKFLRQGASINARSQAHSETIRPQPNPSKKVCVIKSVDQDWIKVEVPGCLQKEVVVSDPGELFIRCDHRRVGFSRDLVASDGHPFPFSILLKTGSHQRALHDLLSANFGLAHVIETRDFVFLDLKPAAVTNSSTEQIDTPKEDSRQIWRFLGSGGAAIVVAMVLVQSFFSPGSSQNDQADIEWHRFQSVDDDSMARGSENTITSALRQYGG